MNQGKDHLMIAFEYTVEKAAGCNKFAGCFLLLIHSKFLTAFIVAHVASDMYCQIFR